MVARVVEGAGYWLYERQAQEMAVGDMLVASRNSGGVLRASVLGPLKLQFFLVQPCLLPGVLAVTDSQQLETGGGAGPGLASVWRAGEPLAQRFAELTAPPARATLSFRCRLLQFWADAVAGLMGGAVESGGRDQLRDRLHELMSQMSEAELASGSFSGLARQLQCSERHLSRLFHDEFGVPFRVRQAETRLRRARQLLEETDAKIVSVAYESGYRHLGLFNAMFKKRFGATPSEWRKRSQRRPHDHLARAAARAGVMLTLWLGLIWQVALGQTNAPVAATQPQPKFEVRSFEVRGNTLLLPETINAILDQAKGSEVTIEQIRKALGELQAAYRERGWATVAVTLPQQQLTNATVIVQVIQAPITVINVVNNRFYSSNNVMRALPSLHTNMILNAHVFQRELDLANANRDRQVYPVLGPGAEPGTSELTLKVQDRFPLHGRMDFNNYYTPGTPDLRLNFSLQYNNLWNRDHQVGLQYGFSPEESKTSSLYVESFFDYPLIANYSAFYRLPLSRRAPLQQSVEANPLKFGYNEATRRFQLPPPTGQPDLTIFASRSTSDTGIQYRPREAGDPGIVYHHRLPGYGGGCHPQLRPRRAARLAAAGGVADPQHPLAGCQLQALPALQLQHQQLHHHHHHHQCVRLTDHRNHRGESAGTPLHHRGLPAVQRGLGRLGPDKLGTTFLNANCSFNVPNLVPDDTDRTSRRHPTPGKPKPAMSRSTLGSTVNK